MPRRELHELPNRSDGAGGGWRLSKLPTYAGVTPQTLFRGFTTADAIGAYVSQLLLSPMNYGPYYWRSDYEWGLALGEAVAIRLHRDQSDNYVGEDFEGFTIATFDGTTITV